ncbi:MAG: Gar1/Naf1 family protein [Candidatus Verstraetearchaeota archaeon]|nr:Gar1/Naf1 family protein [Candidatus Verstraetearchaeota archaeon]
MNYLGVGMHIGKSGLLTVKAKAPPRIGASVVSKSIGVVGTVIDVFGPVGKPYVSVRLTKKIDTRVDGAEFYTEDFPRRKNRRGSKGYGKKPNRHS